MDQSRCSAVWPHPSPFLWVHGDISDPSKSPLAQRVCSWGRWSPCTRGPSCAKQGCSPAGWSWKAHLWRAALPYPKRGKHPCLLCCFFPSLFVSLSICFSSSLFPFLHVFLFLTCFPSFSFFLFFSFSFFFSFLFLFVYFFPFFVPFLLLFLFFDFFFIFISSFLLLSLVSSSPFPLSLCVTPSPFPVSFFSLLPPSLSPLQPALSVHPNALATVFPAIPEVSRSCGWLSGAGSASELICKQRGALIEDFPSPPQLPSL